MCAGGFGGILDGSEVEDEGQGREREEEGGFARAMAQKGQDGLVGWAIWRFLRETGRDRAVGRGARGASLSWRLGASM